MTKLHELSTPITEVTPLSTNDCIYIIDRKKDEFSYPIHIHREFELNFIENAAGCIRIVGDSIETIGEYELVLIGGENLEHTWQQGDSKTESIHEITIQFSKDLFSQELLNRTQFDSIRKMLEDSRGGLSFPLSAIMTVYSKLVKLCDVKDSFYQFIEVIEILYELSKCKDSHKLCNETFAKIEHNADSRRVKKVLNHIEEHLTEKIALQTLAEIAGMSSAAFSRFFKLRTGKNVVDHIIDLRIGTASRLLVDTTKSVVEICYESGFNNITNFNRVFKKRKNLTPKEFRSIYHKKKFLV